MYLASGSLLGRGEAAWGGRAAGERCRCREEELDVLLVLEGTAIVVLMNWWWKQLLNVAMVLCIGLYSQQDGTKCSILIKW
jgi:hypothetical protein